MPDARVIPLHGSEHSLPPVAGGPGEGVEEPAKEREHGDEFGELGERAPEWERQLADMLAFLRRRVSGDYEVDEFGFDVDLNDNVLLPPLKPLYDKWFRVETIGMHNLPADGGALLVANHSGTIPLDALITGYAVHEHHPGHRHLRMLAADLVLRLPVLGPLSRKAGHTLACTPDAERLLHSGELAGVWPEGFKGIGKPYRDRYKLQRFGRGADHPVRDRRRRGDLPEDR